VPKLANVTGVRVDDDGITATSDAEIVLDVLFDDRRIWSFWLHRDGEPVDGGHRVPWPPALRRFLDGVTELKLVEHVNNREVYADEVRLGAAARPGSPSHDTRIAVVNARGLPLGIDKSLRLAQTFDTRSAEHVAPLLDSIEEVLAALKKAGIDAFPAYGTLLGAVRDGQLIGHDSDADLGYVSEHTHPVDVMRESFRLQRALVDMGYRTMRYSGAAFKVDVAEADGSVRGLDVFGGFLREGYLHLMGEVRTPFRREWIFPLGTTTLAGRELPAPAEPDRLLAAMYGESWRVPDPAFHFETPPSTYRRLNGWFRGIRAKRSEWDRAYSGHRIADPPDLTPSDFARWVSEREGVAPRSVVDLGTGRGVDALWFARQGSTVLGTDFVRRASNAVGKVAADEGVDLTFDDLNLVSVRSTLAQAARAARLPGPRVVTARHLADATTRGGRENLWRAARMICGDGGRLYLEVLVRRNRRDTFGRQHHLRALPLRQVVDELEATGARIVARESFALGKDPARPGSGRRIGRLVVEWHR
jgi:hypothetical protein